MKGWVASGRATPKNGALGILHAIPAHRHLEDNNPAVSLFLA